MKAKNEFRLNTIELPVQHEDEAYYPGPLGSGPSRKSYITDRHIQSRKTQIIYYLSKYASRPDPLRTAFLQAQVTRKMALSMLNMDPYFVAPDLFLERALNRTFGHLSSKQNAPPSNIPALHINCDVVEKPSSYAIIAGGSRDALQANQLVYRPGQSNSFIACSRRGRPALCPGFALEKLGSDAPGMTGDDIHVELQDGVLKVSGEKSRQHEEGKQGDKVWRQERSFQKFQRCFSLPEDANPDAISAKLEHGVLTVEFI
eukprot:1162143-Pelagomonas_calceolata.AAC.1